MDHIDWFVMVHYRVSVSLVTRYRYIEGEVQWHWWEKSLRYYRHYSWHALLWVYILVFHLLTTLHKSDPHCHHHLCHHQSLLLFFTLDLKHTSSSSLFHHRLLHMFAYMYGYCWFLFVYQNIKGLLLTSVSHFLWPFRAMHMGDLGLIRTSP